MQKYDVVVVGAGPAGSMAAMKAAQGGAKTLLLERAELPRYKLCGGGVANWIMRKFEIPEDVIEREYKNIVTYIPPNYEGQVFPMPGLGYFGVCRDKFDHCLTKMAIEAGAEFKEGINIRDVVMEEGYVKGVVSSDGQVFRGDLIIGCDGAHSIVAKKSGFWKLWFDQKGENWRDHMWFCVGVEVKMDKKIIDERFEDNYLFFTGREVAPLAYGWLFPKRESVSVGLGSFLFSMNKKPWSYMDYFLNKHPVLPKLLEGGEIVLRRGAWLPIRHCQRPSYGNGVLFAGDSAGMVSPISGEGIYYAVRAGLEAGATAAEAVNIGDVSAHFLSKYEERWLEVMGEQLLYQEKLFLETVGKALEVKDEKLRHELYEKRLLEAIVGYTQWIIEWILKRKEKAKKD
ncbi:MAG: NAD(P)/FAD-dependent oxidoreductase [Candidatus Jordarchaeaceae archaeon]